MAACCDVAAAATCACLAPSTGVTYGDICPVTGRPAACDRRTPRPFPDTMSDLKIFFIKFKYKDILGCSMLFSWVSRVEIQKRLSMWKARIDRIYFDPH